MNFFNLKSYQFRYYICRNTSNNSLSICFIPSQKTEDALSKEQPQKITYELYEKLEELLGKWMSFNPLFNKELSLYEIQVHSEKLTVSDTSSNIRTTFQGLA